MRIDEKQSSAAGISESALREITILKVGKKLKKNKFGQKTKKMNPLQLLLFSFSILFFRKEGDNYEP